MFLAAFFILTSVGLNLINPTIVSAASGAWIDAAHIKVGEVIYIDNKLGDSMDYFSGGVDDCTNVIKGFNADWGNSSADYSKAKLIKKSKDPETGKCGETEESISLSNPDNSQILFHWVDAGTIESAYIESYSTEIVDGNGTRYNKRFQPGIYREIESRPNTFAFETEDDAKSSIRVKSDTAGDYVYREGDIESDPIGVKIGTPIKRKDDAGTGKPTSGGGSVLTGDDRPSCETTGGNPMSWALCPMINGAAAGADWVLDNFLVPFLEGIPIRTSGDSGVFKVWSNFRILANVMLVGILMVVALAQGFGKS